MRYLRTSASVAMATALLAMLGSSSASATTLEVGGVTKNESVTMTLTLTSGTTMAFKTTSGSFQDTCTTFEAVGSTEGSFTGTQVSGKGTVPNFGNCTHTTHAVTTGTLSSEWIKEGPKKGEVTNGTVRSSGAIVEVESTTFGVTLKCTTNNTDLGTITGTDGAPATHAVMDVDAVVNCGFFVPSAKLEASVTVTSPTGLGIVG